MFDLLPGFGARSVLAALKKSLAVIEFSPTGDVINANANFCALLGYQLSEIKGKHHSMFVEPQYARSREYEEFWAKLRRGEFDARESKRIGKGGKEVWIQASYSPIVGLGGKLIKVVAVAADVTETKTRAADDKGRIDAISRAQAAIEYSPDGTILAANESFLKVFGYRLEEILGQNHRMFFDPALVQSDYYRENWEKLKRGEFVSGVLHRFGKGGKELWLQSSYNPIFDHDGKVVKVINVATDVTEAKMRAADDKGRIDAINRTQSVIDFSPDLTILNANDNFLKVFGYRLEEIVGQNHRMLVDPAYAQSATYRENSEKLKRGEFLSGEFRRFGKGGKEVWLQASYNPIFDLNGKVAKIVEFAADVTERVHSLVPLGKALGKLADGDLRQQIETAFMPSLEPLRVDFNNSVGRLHEVISQVVGCSGGIQTGSREISTAADDLARRTEKQASSLEETAAAMNEITATVAKTASGAKEAREVASVAKNKAESAGEVVRNAVGAMDRIKKSSEQVTQIIGVIDEIAFQTNLLALNAGVEAARAGDAGRGFAVVASEVRALAQRASQAAKEIKGLISSSATEVDSGVEMVAATGKALESILTKVSDINQLVADIAAGAQEQATALAEVNAAVGEMDKMTQQNASMAEEASAAARSLSDEGEKLSGLISVFSIEGRASSGDLRAALKEAAPHAFKEAKSPRQSAQEPRIKRGSPSNRAEASAALAAHPKEDWTEF